MIDDRGDAAVAARAGASLREVEPASAVSSTAAIPIARSDFLVGVTLTFLLGWVSAIFFRAGCP